MKKILLLEDEKESLDRLRRILFEIEEKVVVLARDNAKDAYRCAIKIPIDLFIVDITLEVEGEHIPQELEFVEKIRNNEKYQFTPILFITEVKDTLLYTYDKLNCYKFINKPADKYEFKKVVVDSLRWLASIQRNQMFHFQWKSVVYRIEKDAVTYIEMIDDKLYIHTCDRKVRCAPYISMKQMLEKLDNSDFVKCHRSTIVNLNYVKSIDTIHRTLQLKYGLEKIGIGVTYVEFIEEVLGENF